jgi:putative endopeptidase
MLKNLAFVAVCALALTACNKPGASTAESAAPAKATFGSWGYDATQGDSSVKPGDDFWRYALGSWLKTAQIPPDRTFTGVDLKLIEQAETDARKIIQDSGAQTPADGTNAQKIGDFYAAYMDEAGIEKKAVEPLRPDLTAIDSAPDKAALAPILGKMMRTNTTSPFQGYVDINPKDPTQYIYTFVQSGLSFGERDYYLKATPDMVALRKAFVDHAAHMLTLAGYANGKEQANRILALETKMAQIHWVPEKTRQRELTTNIRTRDQVVDLAAGAPIMEILDVASLSGQENFIVSEPDVLTNTSALFASAPLDDWKAYLRYQTLVNYAPFLPKAFDDERFAFYDKALRGAKQPKDRWRRGVDYVNGALGEAVGQIYVQQTFPPASKAAVLGLVENLRASLKAKIQSAKWMSDSTRAEALTKLGTFLPKIGYPDKWKDYSTLTVKRGDLIANAKSGEEWAWNDQVKKLGAPIDRGEWLMTPQTVNAYYRPETNEVTFPAAILQAPYYDPGADPAANYGGIGAVIGHEMSHGFDDQGRKSDSTGKLRDWWTSTDAARYDKEAAKVVAQFGKYEPIKGLHINGKHTLGENIADLAGLSIAYDAYKLSLGGKEAPIIDGLTGDQRFFLAYAQSWETLYSQERLRDITLTNEHSPAEFRVNGIVRNFDPWYAAFNVQKGDKLYLPEAQRARLW